MPRLCNPGWLLGGLAVCAVEALADAPLVVHELRGRARPPQSLALTPEGTLPLLRARWADGSEAGIVWTPAGPALQPLTARALPGPPAKDAIPHSRAGVGAGNIKRALLIGATRRYRHGVLGDGIEAAALRVELRDGRRLRLELDADSVFEDLVPRVADIDGDGVEEVTVVRSYRRAGAALVVLRVEDGRLHIVAETPPIGLPQRWLNPVGVGDFDGDARAELAYVETPHIGGVLRIWEFDGHRLREEGARAGYSNHVIGSTVLDMSLVTDVDGDGVDEIVLPTADRRALAIVGFAGGSFEEHGRIEHERAIVTAIRSVDLDAVGRPEWVYGLSDGRLVVVRR